MERIAEKPAVICPEKLPEMSEEELKVAMDRAKALRFRQRMDNGFFSIRKETLPDPEVTVRP